MKQKILYIFVLITAFFGRGEMVFGQSDVKGYNRTTSEVITYNPKGQELNNFKENYVSLFKQYKFNDAVINTTFKIGTSIDWYSTYDALKISDNKENKISWEIDNNTYVFKLEYFSLLMRASVTGSNVTFTSSMNDTYTSGNLYAISTKFEEGLKNINLGINDYITLKTKKVTWSNYFIYALTCKYTLSYYELDISALNTAITDAEKISVNDLGGFTKTTFTEALKNANTVIAGSAFPTSYWNDGPKGEQNPESVDIAINQLNTALELANAYIAAKAEINKLKTDGDLWPEGLSVNIDNALTALDNATDINGINNAKNQIGIVLERNLPANRYFTLTLPFDYNLDRITDGTNVAYAAQLAFVTHNEHDCYTLYFKKVDGGQMLANQPYIVWLPIGFDKPDFGNVAVDFGEAISITENGWTMQGNYSQLSMTDKFGIAEGLFRKGGAGSTINAYTAYFIPPTHSHGTQNVRARVAVMDEGGNTTYIGELKDGVLQTEEGIYGLDGIQQNQLRKGINIVRQKDGSVRKILK